MATYSQPSFKTYSFGLLVFTNALTNFLLPPGNAGAGRVADIHVRATVTFTNTTTGALVNVGTAATAAKYAQLNCGTTAAGSAVNLGAQSTNNPPFSDINLARDGITEVQVQVVAPTGGSPAGTGFLDVSIDWY